MVAIMGILNATPDSFASGGAAASDEHGVAIGVSGVQLHHLGVSRNFFAHAADVGASRPFQASIGIGLILAGIISFLLCLTIARLTLLGIVSLVQMEFAVLKSA